MPRFELDLNPLEHITVDAIGKPGRACFLYPGLARDRPPAGDDHHRKSAAPIPGPGRGPDAGRTGQAKTGAGRGRRRNIDEDKMRISPPVDPLFRAGEMGLGYDADHDMIVILVREVVMEDGDPEEAAEVRFWCTRLQIRQLADWSKEVINRGRPICPQCGQPMEPEGHFCPKKNGHKH